MQAAVTSLPANASCAGVLNIRLSGTASSQCYADTRSSFPTEPAKPNDIPFICQSVACKTLIDIARSTAPVDCVVGSQYYLYRDIVNPVVRVCANLTTATAAPSVPEAPLSANWTTDPTATHTSAPTSDVFSDSKGNPLRNVGWIFMACVAVGLVATIIGTMTGKCRPAPVLVRVV